MHSPRAPLNRISLIAAAADLCFKPWRHSVVDQTQERFEQNVDSHSLDLLLRIECRNSEGQRYPENDIELEIYRSGEDLNLMLGWFNQPDKPMLWQGQHSVWMDSTSGIRCQAPKEGIHLESLARRLRSLFVV